MEAKFEIKLKAREAINDYNIGETVIIVNPIFDRNIGIAFFPIHKNFDIVYQRQFTGLKDKNGKEIFEGDVVRLLNSNRVFEYFKYCFWLIEPKERINKFPINLITEDTLNSIEIIGNRYDNPELLGDGSLGLTLITNPHQAY